MQDRKPWNTVETTSCHVVVIAYADHIWVAVIGIDHRVLVHAIAQVWIPDLRYIRLFRHGNSRLGNRLLGGG